MLRCLTKRLNLSFYASYKYRAKFYFEQTKKKILLLALYQLKFIDFFLSNESTLKKTVLINKIYYDLFQMYSAHIYATKFTFQT